jgi:DNA-directed RNA polymerase I subunit RPA49
MVDKKRKAGSQANSERPAKKPQTNKVKVTHLSSPDIAKPVVGKCPRHDHTSCPATTRVSTDLTNTHETIAHSPGVGLPSDVSFNAYSKKTSSSGQGQSSTLLLQSSTHPTIDYLATESSTTSIADKHVKQYIAIFDPSTNNLSVIPAKKMTVRSSVRQLPSANDTDESAAAAASDAEPPTQPPTSSSRAALTEAFGTKKSKKAVAAIAENRLLARTADNDIENDPLSSAILSSIQEDAAYADPSLSTTTADIRANKPLPQADLTATDINHFYPLSSLIFPGPARTTLSQMPISIWRDRISSGKEIQSRFRYIAHRVAGLVQLHLSHPDDGSVLEKLQILRYIQLLLELHVYISRLPSRNRAIPPPEKWPANTTSDTSLSAAFQYKLVGNIFPSYLPTQHAKTLLITTILTLTLHVPPPKWAPGQELSVLITEPSDISLDLALQPVEVTKYYRELGCRLETLSDAELTRYGWEKVGKARKKVDSEGKEVTLPKPKFAKLRFPVEFPKISAGRPGKR